MFQEEKEKNISNKLEVIKEEAKVMDRAAVSVQPFFFIQQLFAEGELNIAE